MIRFLNSFYKDSCPIARFDYKNGQFYAQQSDKHGEIEKGRIQKLEKFLNDSIASIGFLNILKKRKIDKNKSFSFFIGISDIGSLPKPLIEKIDDLSVPVFMTDLIITDYKKNIPHIYLVPDFYIISNEYEKKRLKIIKASDKILFKDRKNKAAWRGSQTGGLYNMETKNTLPRSRLVWMGLRHPEFIDAFFTDHVCQVTDSESGKSYKKLMDSTFGHEPKKYFLSFEQMTKYQFNISLDGNISAWQRVPWIFGSGSVLLYHSNYVQFFTPYIKEDIHFVAINPDMTDILEVITTLRSDTDKCIQIIKNAQQFQNEILSKDQIINYYATVLNTVAHFFL